MCGIIGYVGNKKALPVLLQGLEHMQYRGYDSAGIGMLDALHGIEIIKTAGKIQQLKERLEKLSFPDSQRFSQCTTGIGHTRWATHGKPSELNAHPHHIQHIALVHNGVIENEAALKKELSLSGYYPQSETDTEIFGLLLLFFMDQGHSLSLAMEKAFEKIHGHSSVVALSEKEPQNPKTP